jgi:hypothetical protein
MASLTRITTIKRKARRKAQGRRRKKTLRLRSTPSAEEIFAELDARREQPQ